MADYNTKSDFRVSEHYPSLNSPLLSGREVPPPPPLPFSVKGTAEKWT